MKKLILVLLMLISPIAAAQVSSEDVRKIAYNQAVEAIMLAEDRVRICEAKKDKKFSKESMPKLALSDKEWDLALLILSMRADYFCFGDAYGHALMYFVRYQIIEEQFTQKVIDHIVMPNKDIVTIHAFIGSDPAGYIEAEIKYQAINPAVREKLESLNVLKHPFKIPFRTIDAGTNK